MQRLLLSIVVLSATLPMLTTQAWGRGRGGGGRGVARGNFGGGGARTPSMSRPAVARPNYGGAVGNRPNVNQPNVTRPNINNPSLSRPSVTRPNVTRPSTNPNFNRPNVTRPNTNRPDLNRPNLNRPNLNRPATNRPSIDRPNLDRPNINRPYQPGTGGNRPGLASRPSPGDLGDFLDLPGGINRPTTLPGDVGLPGNVGRPGLSNRPGAGNRPGTGNRPGVGNRPGGGDRPNLGNRPELGTRPDFSNRPSIGKRPDVNIGSDNRVNINRDRNFNSIRNHWSNVDRRPFTRDWWNRFPTTLPGWRWHNGWGRYPGSWYWRHGSWAAVGGWFAWSWSTPVVYDYGNDVVYRDNYVYVNEQQVATTEEYYQQAETIAASIPAEVDAEKVEWMPLGVFAIAEQDGIDNGMLIQLAVSKQGIIAGTFYNDATDEGRPLEGKVDRESQRAAWKFADGKNTEIVMETTIYNLTQEESTALVHFGSDQTQNWLMVRLPEEQSEGDTKQQ